MRKLSWKKILSKKGISPVIGMVLISAVLFSVLALYLIWTASQEEFQMQRERERIQQLKLIEGESLEFLTIPGGDLNGQYIYFYNNGTSRPVFQHVYIDDSEVTFDDFDWEASDPRKGYFRITQSVTLAESLKVETRTGNLYSYSSPAAVIDVLSWNDVGDKVILLLDGSKSTAGGGVVTIWNWYVDIVDTTPNAKGAPAQIEISKGSSTSQHSITLWVADSTDSSADPATDPTTWARGDDATITVTIPAEGESGGGEGYPGFGGEGAPGGIYISLGGTGGGTSIAEGRIIAFNIKNFSGRMIPLTSLRFYGVKNPSNYTTDQIYIAPAGKVLTGDDLYYSGATIDDGGIAQFFESYYMGDRDEVHVELRASSGARPKEGEVYMIILYDAATPQSYYTVTVPIRREDSTDVIVFDPGDVFHVVGGGEILQGKSLDLNLQQLMSIGIAFSSPDDDTDPCEDRMIEFNVAGTAYWSGSIGAESTIYLGTDTDADGVPDTGETWDNSRTIQFKFNFTDAALRFYYFVYRFADGSSVAHKIPRFALALASGEPERQDVDVTAGGTVTWDVDITQIDQLNTPMDLNIAGLPCFCVASFSPASHVEMPNTATLTIEVLPGAPTGMYPIVVTGSNNLNAYSCVIFLYLS